MSSDKEVSGVYDVVVVGAGIMGSCTAYDLAKRGKSVLLLEQFDFLHHKGSSHGESRTIRVSYAEEYYTEMMLEAYSLWEKAEQDAGYAVYTKTGELDFGRRQDNPLLTSVVACLQKFNVDHQILTPAQVLDRFPSLHLPEDWYAVYTVEGGILHASKAVAMFQSLAAKHGATLRDRAKVVKITPNSSLEGMNGVSVCTRRGNVVGRKCVLAGGSWMGKLVEKIAGVKLPITPLHTTLAYWAVDESQPNLFSQENGFPAFMCYSDPFVYGTPSIEYPGMIKVSNHSGTPCDPDTRTVAPDIRMMKEVMSPWLAQRFKGLVKHDAPVIAEGCIYSMTPDEDFILDFLPSSPDILIAAGFSGHGFKMGPLIGRIMADLALTGAAPGGASGNWLQYFSLKRFENNAGGNVKDFGAHVVPYGVVPNVMIEDSNLQKTNLAVPRDT